MRLNSAALNGRRFNIGAQVFPKALAVDAVGFLSSALTATRYASGTGSAASVLSAALQAGAKRFLAGDIITVNEAAITSSVRRNGSGIAVVECAGSLYYTRLIYGNGGGLIQVIAISDVGVVYGEGEGAAAIVASLTGRRAKTSGGDAIGVTAGSMSASAIRRAATDAVTDIVPLLAQLDTATIKSNGKRYINATGDAVVQFDLVDNGMKRQVFIGSVDMFVESDGFATAIRNATSVAQMNLLTDGAFQAFRRGQGAGIVQCTGALNGEIFVRGTGDAVIQLSASMTGYVYRQSGVLQAICEIATELNAARLKLGAASAPLICAIELDGRRNASASGFAVIELSAESTATDYNFLGLDDAAEIFYRPAVMREFSRPAMTREWSRL